LPKLRRNRLRDKANLQSLAADGWDVLVIWQCELKDIASVGVKIKRFLGITPL